MRSMALSRAQPSPTPVATATPNPTSAWKTYSSPALSLEFKYPSDLSVDELDNGVVSFEDAGGTSKFNLTGFQTFNLIDYQKYLKSQTAENNLRHLTIFKDEQGRTWETDMVLGEVFNYTGILSRDDKYYVLSLQSNFGEDGDGGASFRQFMEQILSTVKVIDCESNQALNLTLVIPKDWECSAIVDRSDYGALTLNSPDFTIEISDGGRGPYCGDGEDPNNLCQTRQLTLSDDWTFTIYNYQGEDKELFSGLSQTSRGTNRWISLKYPNMETKQLTLSQKQVLLKFLNTIKFTN
jgi:hypothetical protein